MKEEKNKKNLKEKDQNKKSKTEKKKPDVVKMKEKKSSSEMIKKAVSRTSYLIIMLAVIIGLYIGINLLVEKLNITDIDLTADRVYSLTETSKKIARDINKDVKIIIVNMNGYEGIKDFSNRYSKENSRITVEVVDDINKYPDLAAKYNLTSNSYGLIMECGTKSKILTESDLYTYDYQTYERKDRIEEGMTNALLDITLEKKPKIYFLSGNNPNLDLYMYAFKENLKNEANEVEDLDLLTKGKVPDDCNVLVLSTLTKDFKDIERDAILNYIKKGGKIALFSDANVTKLKLPNFQKVLDEYGVSISEGILIEQDKSKMLANSPSAILVTVNPGTSITKDINMSTNACFINSGKLIIKEEKELEKLGVESEILASTSSKAFYRENLSIESTSKQASDIEGVFNVGALLTKKINDDTTSKLIIYSNNMFVTSMQISLNEQYYSYAYALYNNEDVALNSISYLAGRDDVIMIRKDVETTPFYTVTQEQQTTILTIIFAVPVLIVIAGIIVWQVRRRKK